MVRLGFVALLPWLPLTTSAGRNFEYEYALAVSLGIWFILPLLPWPNVPNTLTSLARRLTIDLALVLASAVVAFFASSCPCSFMGFVFWLPFQVAPALIWTCGVKLLLDDKHPRKNLWILALVNSTLIIQLLIQTLVLPQKRFLHPTFGFWHGPVYDRYIAISDALVQNRILQFAAGVAICWLLLTWRRQFLVRTAVFCLTVVALQYLPGEGTELGMKPLEARFAKRLIGAGFELHYVPRDNNDQQIQDLFWATHFHIEDLQQQLGIEPPFIKVFVYPGSRDKKLWFGGAGTDITDVFSPSIHISERPLPHPTLRHELVHAALAREAYFGLGFHPNMALTEGIAVALAPQKRPWPLDVGARFLIESKKIDPYGIIQGQSFLAAAASRSYTIAGSFAKHLVDNQLTEHLLAVYSGQDWATSFNRQNRNLIQEWLDKLHQSPASQDTSLFGETLYREEGTLRSTCPHSRIDLGPRTPSNFKPASWSASDYKEWLAAIDPRPKRHQLQQAKHEIKQLFHSGKLANFDISRLPQQDVEQMISLEDVHLALLKWDVLLTANHNSEAAKQAHLLRAVSSRHRLPDHLLRAIEARLLLLTLDDQPTARSWLRYVANLRAIPERRIHEEDPWIIAYLKVRRYEQSDPTVSLDQLAKRQIPDELSRELRAEWFRLLANLYGGRGQYSKARSMMRSAAVQGPPGHQAFYLLQSRRYAYFATNRPGSEDRTTTQTESAP